MIKYCQILNEETGLVAIGKGDDAQAYTEMGMVQRNVEQSDVDNCWYLAEKCPHLTPEEKAAREAERIGNLQCTKRVFVLMLEELGFNYKEQIKPLIESNDRAQMEWDLCVELQRKNPLLDIMASEMGVTSKQLDDLFKFANGEITQEEFLGV